MSEQPDGFLQMKPSYNFDRNRITNYRNRTIESGTLHKWTQQNMYKSSYAHFHSKESTNPKNNAIPGYAGYIPSIKPQNIHARGFSAMAKQSFQSDNLSQNKFGLASTGFNLNKQALIDKSKLASSSKYGKSQLQRAHPGWNASWVTTTKQFYQNPRLTLNPTYRQTDKFLQTQKAQTKGSGYSTNHAFCDGNGWKPHPILRGDNNRSQYRDRFNADHPFHRDAFVVKKPQLKHKLQNYEYN